LKPAVLVTRRIPASALALLRDALDVDLAESGLDHAALCQRVVGKDGVVALLTDRIDEAVYDAAGPSLKIVANVAVGYDNIDVPAARARGVIVTNTPEVLTGAVAEFTWGLILAITRRLSEGERLIRRGDWKGWSLEFMLGSELAGKQLGVVGAGRIGRAVAAKADAFGMRVVFADHRARGGGSGRSDQANDPHISLDELLATSDVVSLHVPLRQETRHLIDRTALVRMKRTAFLVNTARGPVVDEAALVWALQERLIAGAALDVFEHEPQVHAGLLTLENVLLVPHLGSATRETRTAMAELAARNVIAVLSGAPPLTPVGS
jgi:lactate dehydrogenase-like 2-hydroxyacid dehydrogenase